MTAAEQKFHKLYGRMFLVVAEFPETPEGIREANLHMEQHPSVGVLAVEDGRVILANNDDKGVSTDVAQLMERMKAAAAADRWGRHGEVIGGKFFMVDASRNRRFAWRIGGEHAPAGRVHTELKAMADRGQLPADSIA